MQKQRQRRWNHHGAGRKNILGALGFWAVFLSAPVLGQEPSRAEVALLQIALDRNLFSPNCIDGRLGTRTRLALVAFQEAHGLPVDGVVGARTQELLGMNEGFAEIAYTTYTVTEEDLASLGRAPESWRERAAQTSLPYETLLELVAERFHATEEFIHSLNPGVHWFATPAGTVLHVPHIIEPKEYPTAAKVRISLSKKVIAVFDVEDRMVAFFPCSIGREKERRPVGELKIVALAPNPNYTFDPSAFPELEEAREIHSKLIIPPGPNNPVGTMWMTLGREDGSIRGYGIHGTPKPEEIGKTESLGCFRLANWNAERLAKMISIGTTVIVEE